MSPALYATVWIALGFLLGSIPFGFIVARARGVDIRTRGSGNIGMTNVWRELGAGAGITVLVLDALKGWLPVWLTGNKQLAVFYTDISTGTQVDITPPTSPESSLFPLLYLPMIVGLAAILGHTFSPWMKFKGGKGVATGLGVILALFGWWSLLPLAVFLLTLALSRYVSLGSILAALAVAALPFVAAYTPMGGIWPSISHLWPFGLLVALLVLATHRENIRRIIAGTERRVGAKKSSPA